VLLFVGNLFTNSAFALGRRKSTESHDQFGSSEDVPDVAVGTEG
jgi:hypothetical protein